MQRVIAYVDGFNLYYGLRDRGWKGFYWLNVQALAQHLLKPRQALAQTKYFTTIVEYPPDKQQRQTTFLEALQTLPGLSLHYGHFLANPVTCQHCGHTYQAYHEKMTDVNIAVEILTDAFQDSFDTALLISADSDLVSVIRAVRRLFGQKRIVVAVPPRRHSEALRQTAHAYIHVGSNVLRRSVFPDQVVKPDGFVLRRPTEWR